MSGHPLPTSSAKFDDALEIGFFWENFVIEAIRRHHLGRHLEIHQIEQVRKKPEDPVTVFAGRKDIMLSCPGGMPRPVEIKSMNYSFTSPDDFPFPMLICYQSYASPAGIPHVFVSQHTQVILGVQDYGANWEKRFIADKRPGRHGRECWCIPERVPNPEFPDDPSQDLPMKSRLLTFDDWMYLIARYLMQ